MGHVPHGLFRGAGGVGPYLALVLRQARWAGALTSLRTARDSRLPPTLFWGRQGAGEYGPTDLIALQALTLLDDMRCGCGCNGWSDECLNADLQDVWEPRTGTHWRQAALAKGREQFKTELEDPGVFLYLHDQRTEGD